MIIGFISMFLIHLEDQKVRSEVDGYCFQFEGLAVPSGVYGRPNGLLVVHVLIPGDLTHAFV